MKPEEIKSLQRKVINILTNVQTKTIGLEAAKEQITNLFGVYEESEQIETLNRLNKAQEDYIEFLGKHISRYEASLSTQGWFKINEQAVIDGGVHRANIANLKNE